MSRGGRELVPGRELVHHHYMLMQITFKLFILYEGILFAVVNYVHENTTREDKRTNMNYHKDVA